MEQQIAIIPDRMLFLNSGPYLLCVLRITTAKFQQAQDFSRQREIISGGLGFRLIGDNRLPLANSIKIGLIRSNFRFEEGRK